LKQQPWRCFAGRPLLYAVFPFLQLDWFTFTPTFDKEPKKMGSGYAPTPTFVINPFYYKTPFKKAKAPAPKAHRLLPAQAPKNAKSPQKLPHHRQPLRAILMLFFGRCPPLKNSPINSNGCEAQKPRTQCNGKKNSEENLLACGFPQAKSPKRIDD